MTKVKEAEEEAEVAVDAAAKGLMAGYAQMKGGQSVSSDFAMSEDSFVTHVQEIQRVMNILEEMAVEKYMLEQEKSESKFNRHRWFDFVDDEWVPEPAAIVIQSTEASEPYQWSDSGDESSQPLAQSPAEVEAEEEEEVPPPPVVVDKKATPPAVKGEFQKPKSISIKALNIEDAIEDPPSRTIWRAASLARTSLSRVTSRPSDYAGAQSQEDSPQMSPMELRGALSPTQQEKEEEVVVAPPAAPLVLSPPKPLHPAVEMYIAGQQAGQAGQAVQSSSKPAAPTCQKLPGQTKTYSGQSHSTEEPILIKAMKVLGAEHVMGQAPLRASEKSLDDLQPYPQAQHMPVIGALRGNGYRAEKKKPGNSSSLRSEHFPYSTHGAYNGFRITCSVRSLVPKPTTPTAVVAVANMLSRYDVEGRPTDSVWGPPKAANQARPATTNAGGLSWSLKSPKRSSSPVRPATTASTTATRSRSKSVGKDWLGALPSPSRPCPSYTTTEPLGWQDSVCQAGRIQAARLPGSGTTGPNMWAAPTGKLASSISGRKSPTLTGTLSGTVGRFWKQRASPPSSGGISPKSTSAGGGHDRMSQAPHFSPRLSTAPHSGPGLSKAPLQGRHSLPGHSLPGGEFPARLRNPGGGELSRSADYMGGLGEGLDSRGAGPPIVQGGGPRSMAQSVGDFKGALGAVFEEVTVKEWEQDNCDWPESFGKGLGQSGQQRRAATESVIFALPQVGAPGMPPSLIAPLE
eukprot:gene9469-32456_t